MVHCDLRRGSRCAPSTLEPPAEGEQVGRFVCFPALDEGQTNLRYGIRNKTFATKLRTRTE